MLTNDYLKKREVKWKRYYKALRLIKQSDDFGPKYDIDLLQQKLRISLEETKQITNSLIKNKKVKIVDDKFVPILKCDICGKELDIYDIGNEISNGFNYGSKYDGNFIDIELCTNCYDKIIDKILPLFNNNPMKNYDELRQYQYNNEPY